MLDPHGKRASIRGNSGLHGGHGSASGNNSPVVAATGQGVMACTWQLQLLALDGDVESQRQDTEAGRHLQKDQERAHCAQDVVV